MAVPKADIAFIGGSSTYSISFPEDLGIKVKQIGFFETPYGLSPEFKLFEISGTKVLTCKMHGWRKGIDRGLASLQVFSVLKEAGVKKVITEGGVGSIHLGLKPGSLILPDDFIDETARKDLSLTNDYLLIMREPVCPSLSETLKNNALKMNIETNIGGVYVCTDGRRFESKAEVKMFSILGADIIGQSLVPEVYLSREIGACFASLQLVVNYAEGVVDEWDYDLFKDIFYKKAEEIAGIIIGALNDSSNKNCNCQKYRKETLLKE
jgi:5'-methylthioadenosine phosphorylase